MKLRNFEIREIINNLAGQNSLIYSTEKMPIKILWVIDGNLTKLKEIAERIDQKQEEINQSYNTEEKSENFTFENGEEGRRVKEEFLQEYREEINELMMIENEVNIETLSIDDFNNISLSPAEFGSIRFMLEENKGE